jgi:uncharacterized protein (DUF2336 family)
MGLSDMLHDEPASLPFIATLGAADNPESQRILLRITTDHFISRQDHSGQQLAQFEKTMLRLIAKADPSTRLIVARKLAVHPLAPPAVLEAIEELGGDASLHLLEYAALPRERLVAATSGNESRACAVAKRADLDTELATPLSLRPEHSIALALAGNTAAPLDAQTYAALVRRAEQDRSLADTLLSRPSLGLESSALFLLASSQQRAAILAAAQRAELGRAIATRREPDRERLVAEVEQHALARHAELFIAALAQALGCERALAERIATDQSGEPMAVALKALEAPQDLTVRVLISGEYSRIGSLIRLTDGLNPAAARRVIGALVGAQKARRAQYQPALDPDAAPAPGRAAAAPAAAALNPGASAAQRQRAFAHALAQLRVQKSG